MWRVVCADGSEVCRRKLLERGKLGQLAFIATQTDTLVPTEVAENLSLVGDSAPQMLFWGNVAFVELHKMRQWCPPRTQS